MKNEPALTAGALVTLVTATLVLLQRFGVKLGSEQLDAIVDFVSLAAPVILPMLGAWYVRQRVTPVAKLEGKSGGSSPPGPMVVGLVFVFVALLVGCSSAPKSCARYGTLEAEYGLALQEACGKLDDVECQEQRPNSVKQVDERFRPQFESAERCQTQ